ncbi:hypothetical protein PSPO01_14369 [Paraphaeosphaeria sporulosa]
MDQREWYAVWKAKRDGLSNHSPESGSALSSVRSDIAVVERWTVCVAFAVSRASPPIVLFVPELYMTLAFPNIHPKPRKHESVERWVRRFVPSIAYPCKAMWLWNGSQRISHQHAPALTPSPTRIGNLRVQNPPLDSTRAGCPKGKVIVGG